MEHRCRRPVVREKFILGLHDTVRGSGVSQEDLMAYAEAIDFELLGKLASGN